MAQDTVVAKTWILTLNSAVYGKTHVLENDDNAYNDRALLKLTGTVRFLDHENTGL